MGRILENWRVITATLFAVILIVVSFVIARDAENPRSVEASTESALLQAIATKDTDGDGLPDWEESIYGTDPNITDTFKLGMTDGEAVAQGLVVPKAIADIKVDTTASGETVSDGLPPAPTDGTLTAAFAKSFFTLFVAAKQKSGGADLTEAEMQQVASDAIASLSSVIVPATNFKSAKDITVSGSGAEAMKDYAIKAEAILLKNTTDASKSELLYLQDAVQNSDSKALSHITSIAKAYRDSAAGLSALPVPAELSAEHLTLINSLMRLSQIATDFTRVEGDPLATILALQQYPQAVLNLGTSFINIGKQYKLANIIFPAGTEGASFVNLIRDVANEQAAAKKP